MKELDPEDACSLVALARRFQMREQDIDQMREQGGVPGTGALGTDISDTDMPGTDTPGADMPGMDSRPLEGTEHNVLAEDCCDPVEQEVRSLVQGLGRPQQHELVALMWLGRGDAEPEEFAALVRQARDDLPADDVSDYLLSHPQLAEYLGIGLAHFGYACDE